METGKIDFTHLRTANVDLSPTAFKINMGQVKDNDSFLDRLQLFIAHFNKFPNSISEGNINCKKAHDWFFGKYELEIKKHYFRRLNSNWGKRTQTEEIIYFIYNDLMVYFNTQYSFVRFLFSETDISLVENLTKEIAKFKERINHKSELSLLVNTSSGIETNTLAIKKPKLSIDDNYNDDFKDIHQTIKKRLAKQNDKGIVLLHGKPGTGKTSYIRYLAASAKKKVVFLPPDLIREVTNPNLMSVLIDNSNSIFVIEDAENIVMDREQNSKSPVSTLLNVSDGLLSDCLNIQVICSFNTDISKVDSALLRKGRLIAKYEFKELETQKAQALSYKLGFNTIIHSPMTLTAIYNQEEKDFYQTEKRNTIGFKAK